MKDTQCYELINIYFCLFVLFYIKTQSKCCYWCVLPLKYCTVEILHAQALKAHFSHPPHIEMNLEKTRFRKNIQALTTPDINAKVWAS